MYIQQLDKYNSYILLTNKELERLNAVVDKESDASYDFIKAYNEWKKNKVEFITISTI